MVPVFEGRDDSNEEDSGLRFSFCRYPGKSPARWALGKPPGPDPVGDPGVGPGRGRTQVTIVTQYYEKGWVGPYPRLLRSSGNGDYKPALVHPQTHAGARTKD